MANVKTKDLDIGHKWGALQVIDLENKLREVQDGAVKDKFYEIEYIFKCNCGEEFKVWDHEFPGKKEMRDCSCGAGGDQESPLNDTMRLGRPPKPQNRKKVTASASIAFDTWEWLHTYSSDRSRTMSWVIDRFLAKGIEAHLTEGEEAAVDSTKGERNETDR